MIRKLLALLLGLVLVASACGSDDDSETSSSDDEAADTEESADDSDDGDDGDDSDDEAMEEEDHSDDEAAAGGSDADRAVVIPTHNWSSQLVSAEVVGRTLQEAGYEVEYVPSDSQAVYAAMCEGDVDLVHEVWEGAFGVAYEEQVDKGCVVEAHTHNAVTREEWWYPRYVEDLCPGLPDWEALNACADIFATAETGDKGRFLGGPVDWLKGDEERVEGLGMNFEVINAGSAATLWSELDAAAANEEPIVLFNWTPNFVEAVYDGEFIEFPEFEPDCRTDPAWGVNPDLTHDCGNPANGYLKTGVSTTFIDEMPGAYAIVENVDLTNTDLAAMAAMVDVEGMDAIDAAEKWMADNESTWKSWLG
jgi:glycine betaine/proline transport system substrate-binding protein